jgi:hypothetical protein
MMSQVAEAYGSVREQMVSHTPVLREEIKAEIHP